MLKLNNSFTSKTYLIYVHKQSVNKTTPIARLHKLANGIIPIKPNTPDEKYIIITNVNKVAGVLAAANIFFPSLCFL